MSFLSSSAPFGNAVRQWLAGMAVLRRGASRSSLPDWRNLAGRRVGLIKWDGIGDFVLATTFLRALQARHPDLDVTLFCQPHVATLAERQFPKWNRQTVPARTKPIKRIYGALDVRRRFSRLEPFDVVIDLRAMRDMGDAVMASWIPARCKVALVNQYRAKGVAFRGEDRIYDHLLAGPVAPAEEVCLDILNYRRWAELFLGAGDRSPADTSQLLPRLTVSPAERESLLKKLNTPILQDGARPFLLVCPGSLEPIKEYPPRDLARALGRVLEERKLPIVLAGSEADRRVTAPLREALGDGAEILDVTGRLSLPEHAAMVSLAGAVMCMDSSTAHVAGALGRPAVVLLGGGHPGMFAPWGESPTFRWLQNPLPCYGCNWVCVFDKPICIRDIGPDFIAQNLLEVLAIRVRGS